MAIKALQKEYIQKSRLFLYALLGIPRTFPIKPIETYMAWTGKYDIQDQCLICVYTTEISKTFTAFLEVVYTHPLYEKEYRTNTQTILIFNFTKIKEHIECVHMGAYSKIEDALKKHILHFFNNDKTHYTIMDSYLNPEKYIEDYAILYNVKPDILKTVGEVCASPDFKKETLEVNMKSIIFESNFKTNEHE